MDAPVVVISKQKRAPFARGSGEWSGVVMIERPKRAEPKSECVCQSARSIEFNGRRAVVCKLPYSFARQFFRSEDGDTVYHYAEFKDGRIEIYERARHRDFFLQAGGAG